MKKKRIRAHRRPGNTEKGLTSTPRHLYTGRVYRAIGFRWWHTGNVIPATREVGSGQPN